MSHNLLARARENRIVALDTLNRRKNNIFDLADARENRAARERMPVFISCRRPALPAPAPAMIDRIAA